ncbi:MAG: bacteriocin [Spirochaetia bacterium]|nr:bacteriocin [Spirochaetia bacterium]
MELTVEQAKAYLAELQDIELDDKELEKIAGGSCPIHRYMG